MAAWRLTINHFFCFTKRNGVYRSALYYFNFISYTVNKKPDMI